MPRKPDAFPASAVQPNATDVRGQQQRGVPSSLPTTSTNGTSSAGASAAPILNHANANIPSAAANTTSAGGVPSAVGGGIQPAAVVPAVPAGLAATVSAAPANTIGSSSASAVSVERDSKRLDALANALRFTIVPRYTRWEGRRKLEVNAIDTLIKEGGSGGSTSNGSSNSTNKPPTPKPPPSAEQHPFGYSAATFGQLKHAKDKFGALFSTIRLSSNAAASSVSSSVAADASQSEPRRDHRLQYIRCLATVTGCLYPDSVGLPSALKPAESTTMRLFEGSAANNNNNANAASDNATFMVRVLGRTIAPSIGDGALHAQLSAESLDGTAASSSAVSSCPIVRAVTALEESLLPTAAADSPLAQLPCVMHPSVQSLMVFTGEVVEVIVPLNAAASVDAASARGFIVGMGQIPVVDASFPAASLSSPTSSSSADQLQHHQRSMPNPHAFAVAHGEAFYGSVNRWISAELLQPTTVSVVPSSAAEVASSSSSSPSSITFTAKEVRNGPGLPQVTNLFGMSAQLSIEMPFVVQRAQAEDGSSSSTSSTVVEFLPVTTVATAMRTNWLRLLCGKGRIPARLHSSNNAGANAGALSAADESSSRSWQWVLMAPTTDDSSSAAGGNKPSVGDHQQQQPLLARLSADAMFSSSPSPSSAALRQQCGDISVWATVLEVVMSVIASMGRQSKLTETVVPMLVSEVAASPLVVHVCSALLAIPPPPPQMSGGDGEGSSSSSSAACCHAVARARLAAVNIVNTCAKMCLVGPVMARSVGAALSTSTAAADYSTVLLLDAVDGIAGFIAKLYAKAALNPWFVAFLEKGSVGALMAAVAATAANASAAADANAATNNANGAMVVVPPAVIAATAASFASSATTADGRLRFGSLFARHFEGLIDVFQRISRAIRPFESEQFSVGVAAGSSAASSLLANKVGAESYDLEGLCLMTVTDLLKPPSLAAIVKRAAASSTTNSNSAAGANGGGAQQNAADDAAASTSAGRLFLEALPALFDDDDDIYVQNVLGMEGDGSANGSSANANVFATNANGRVSNTNNGAGGRDHHNKGGHQRNALPHFYRKKFRQRQQQQALLQQQQLLLNSNNAVDGRSGPNVTTTNAAVFSAAVSPLLRHAASFLAGAQFGRISSEEEALLLLDQFPEQFDKTHVAVILQWWYEFSVEQKLHQQAEQQRRNAENGIVSSGSGNLTAAELMAVVTAQPISVSMSQLQAFFNISAPVSNIDGGLTSPTSRNASAAASAESSTDQFASAFSNIVPYTAQLFGNSAAVHNPEEALLYLWRSVLISRQRLFWNGSMTVKAYNAILLQLHYEQQQQQQGGVELEEDTNSTEDEHDSLVSTVAALTSATPSGRQPLVRSVVISSLGEAGQVAVVSSSSSSSSSSSMTSLLLAAQTSAQFVSCCSALGAALEARVKVNAVYFGSNNRNGHKSKKGNRRQSDGNSTLRSFVSPIILAGPPSSSGGGKKKWGEPFVFWTVMHVRESDLQFEAEYEDAAEGADNNTATVSCLFHPLHDRDVLLQMFALHGGLWATAALDPMSVTADARHAVALLPNTSHPLLRASASSPSAFHSSDDGFVPVRNGAVDDAGNTDGDDAEMSVSSLLAILNHQRLMRTIHFTRNMRAEAFGPISVGSNGCVGPSAPSSHLGDDGAVLSPTSSSSDVHLTVASVSGVGGAAAADLLSFVDAKTSLRKAMLSTVSPSLATLLEGAGSGHGMSLTDAVFSVSLTASPPSLPAAAAIGGGGSLGSALKAVFAPSTTASNNNSSSSASKPPASISSILTAAGGEAFVRRAIANVTTNASGGSTLSPQQLQALVQMLSSRVAVTQAQPSTAAVVSHIQNAAAAEAAATTATNVSHPSLGFPLIAANGNGNSTSSSSASDSLTPLFDFLPQMATNHFGRTRLLEGIHGCGKTRLLAALAMCVAVGTPAITMSGDDNDDSDNFDSANGSSSAKRPTRQAVQIETLKRIRECLAVVAECAANTMMGHADDDDHVDNASSSSAVSNSQLSARTALFLFQKLCDATFALQKDAIMLRQSAVDNNHDYADADNSAGDGAATCRLSLPVIVVETGDQLARNCSAVAANGGGGGLTSLGAILNASQARSVKAPLMVSIHRSGGGGQQLQYQPPHGNNSHTAQQQQIQKQRRVAMILSEFTRAMKWVNRFIGITSAAADYDASPEFLFTKANAPAVMPLLLPASVLAELNDAADAEKAEFAAQLALMFPKAFSNRCGGSSGGADASPLSSAANNNSYTQKHVLEFYERIRGFASVFGVSEDKINAFAVANSAASSLSSSSSSSSSSPFVANGISSPFAFLPNTVVAPTLSTLQRSNAGGGGANADDDNDNAAANDDQQRNRSIFALSDDELFTVEAELGVLYMWHLSCALRQLVSAGSDSDGSSVDGSGQKNSLLCSGTAAASLLGPQQQPHLTAKIAWDALLCVGTNEILLGGGANSKRKTVSALLARPIIRVPASRLATDGPVLRLLVGNNSSTSPFATATAVSLEDSLMIMDSSANGKKKKATATTAGAAALSSSQQQQQLVTLAYAPTSVSFWDALWRSNAFTASSSTVGTCRSLLSMPDPAPVVTLIDDADMLHVCAYLHLPSTPDVMAVGADGIAQGYPTSTTNKQAANDEKLSADIAASMNTKFKLATSAAAAAAAAASAGVVANNSTVLLPFAPPPADPSSSSSPAATVVALPTTDGAALQPCVDAQTVRSSTIQVAQTITSSALLPSRGFLWRVYERMTAPAVLPLLSGAPIIIGVVSPPPASSSRSSASPSAALAQLLQQLQQQRQQYYQLTFPTYKYLMTTTAVLTGGFHRFLRSNEALRSRRVVIRGCSHRFANDDVANAVRVISASLKGCCVVGGNSNANGVASMGMNAHQHQQRQQQHAANGIQPLATMDLFAPPFTAPSAAGGAATVGGHQSAPLNNANAALESILAANGIALSSSTTAAAAAVGVAPPPTAAAIAAASASSAGGGGVVASSVTGTHTIPSNVIAQVSTLVNKGSQPQQVIVLSKASITTAAASLNISTNTNKQVVQQPTVPPAAAAAAPPSISIGGVAVGAARLPANAVLVDGPSAAPPPISRPALPTASGGFTPRPLGGLGAAPRAGGFVPRPLGGLARPIGGLGGMVGGRPPGGVLPAAVAPSASSSTAAAVTTSAGDAAPAVSSAPASSVTSPNTDSGSPTNGWKKKSAPLKGEKMALLAPTSANMLAANANPFKFEMCLGGGGAASAQSLSSTSVVVENPLSLTSVLATQSLGALPSAASAASGAIPPPHDASSPFANLVALESNVVMWNPPCWSDGVAGDATTTTAAAATATKKKVSKQKKVEDASGLNDDTALAADEDEDDAADEDDATAPSSSSSYASAVYASLSPSESSIVQQLVAQLVAMHKGVGVDRKTRLLMTSSSPLGAAAPPVMGISPDASNILLFRPSTRGASATSLFEEHVETMRGVSSSRRTASTTDDNTDAADGDDNANATSSTTAHQTTQTTTHTVAAHHAPVTRFRVCPYTARVTVEYLPLSRIVGATTFASVVVLDDYRDADTVLDGRASAVQATHTTERYLCKLQQWLLLAATRARAGIVIINPLRMADVETSAATTATALARGVANAAAGGAAANTNANNANATATAAQYLGTAVPASDLEDATFASPLSLSLQHLIAASASFNTSAVDDGAGSNGGKNGGGGAMNSGATGAVVATGSSLASAASSTTAGSSATTIIGKRLTATSPTIVATMFYTQLAHLVRINLARSSSVLFGAAPPRPSPLPQHGGVQQQPLPPNPFLDLVPASCPNFPTAFGDAMPFIAFPSLVVNCRGHKKIRFLLTTEVGEVPLLGGVTATATAVAESSSNNTTAASSSASLFTIRPRWLGVGNNNSANTNSSNTAAAAFSSAPPPPSSHAACGAPACEGICLQPFTGCPQRTHLCLRVCHSEDSTNRMMGGGAQSSLCCGTAAPSSTTTMSGTCCGSSTNAASNGFEYEEAVIAKHNLPPLPAPHTPAVAAHDACPYPCARSLPCGHPCQAPCGVVPCPPICTRKVVIPRPCGQPVVSGWDEATKRPLFTLFNHFVHVTCGERGKVMLAGTYEVLTASVANAAARPGDKRPKREGEANDDDGAPMDDDDDVDDTSIPEEVRDAVRYRCNDPVTVRCRQCGHEQHNLMKCWELQLHTPFLQDGEAPNTVDIPNCPSCRAKAIEARGKFVANLLIAAGGGEAPSSSPTATAAAADNFTFTPEQSAAFADRLTAVYKLERQKAELRMKNAGLRTATTATAGAAASPSGGATATPLTGNEDYNKAMAALGKILSQQNAVEDAQKLLAEERGKLWLKAQRERLGFQRHVNDASDLSLRNATAEISHVADRLRRLCILLRSSLVDRLNGGSTIQTLAEVQQQQQQLLLQQQQQK